MLRRYNRPLLGGRGGASVASSSRFAADAADHDGVSGGRGRIRALVRNMTRAFGLGRGAVADDGEEDADDDTSARRVEVPFRNRRRSVNLGSWANVGSVKIPLPPPSHGVDGEVD